MKNRNNYIQYIPFLFLFFLTSCFDDEGNYNYVDIKDAFVNIQEVTENDGQISRDRYSDLVLSPEIEFNAGGKAEEYTFEWSMYPQQPAANEDDTYDPKKVIGTTINLSYHLTEAPSNYYVVLRVTHKETQAITDYRFALAVNSVKGWLIYDEDAAGSGDLQIIRDGEIVPGLSASQNGVVRNYFSTSNEGKKLSGGKSLAWRNMSNRYDHIFLFKEDGFVKMQGTTYEVISEDYSTLFFSQPSVYAPMAHYYNNPAYGGLEFLMNNNEVYVIRWNMMGQTDKFSTPLNVFGTAVKFNPFIAPIPAVTGNTNRAVLYNDITHSGQFITVNNNGSQGSPGVTGGAFNPLKINPDGTTKLRLKYLGQGRDGITCAVFRDELNGDNPWLYVADFRVAASPLALAKYDLSGLQQISQAKLFVSGNRGDVLFYATDHEVYSYVFGGGATPLLTKPGEEIVSMKLYTHSANEDFTGRILFVATYDGAEGRVYKIEFNELNGQLEGEIEEFSGFGRIVDMISKE